MGSPIGHGVLRGMRRDRPHPAPPVSPGRAWIYFALATGCLSWTAFAALGAPAVRLDEPVAIQALWAAGYYAAILGWPPVVGAWLARLVQPDLAAPAIRSRSRRALALGATLIVAAGVTGLALRLAGTVDHRAAIAGLGALVVVGAGLALGELGWRGVPLRCAVARWGDGVGLGVHGLAALAWYAPLLVVSTGA